MFAAFAVLVVFAVFAVYFTDFTVIMRLPCLLCLPHLLRFQHSPCFYVCCVCAVHIEFFYMVIMLLWLLYSFRMTSLILTNWINSLKAIAGL